MNVVITGGSKGLGRAFAEAFAAGGHDLALCSRSEEELQVTVLALRKQFPEIRVEAKAFDLSSKGGAEEYAAWVRSRFGVVDILINNAGRFLGGNIYDEPEGTLEAMINTNLYSAYHLTRALLPVMMGQKKGQIFNICSVAGLQAYPNGGAYSISKFALLGFSRNLREELKPYGIKVTAVCPGATYTASWEGSGIDPERMMAPEDVAAMVYATANLSDRAVVEDLIMRPVLGDL
jgi:short-subunit dehydrogenase